MDVTVPEDRGTFPQLCLPVFAPTRGSASDTGVRSLVRKCPLETGCGRVNIMFSIAYNIYIYI